MLFFGILDNPSQPSNFAITYRMTKMLSKLLKFDSYMKIEGMWSGAPVHWRGRKDLPLEF